MEERSLSRKGKNGEVVGKWKMEGERQQLIPIFWGYQNFQGYIRHKRWDSAGLGKGLLWG